MTDGSKLMSAPNSVAVMLPSFGIFSKASIFTIMFKEVAVFIYAKTC